MDRAQVIMEKIRAVRDGATRERELANVVNDSQSEAHSEGEFSVHAPLTFSVHAPLTEESVEDVLVDLTDEIEAEAGTSTEDQKVIAQLWSGTDIFDFYEDDEFLHQHHASAHIRAEPEETRQARPTFFSEGADSGEVVNPVNVMPEDQPKKERRTASEDFGNPKNKWNMKRNLVLTAMVLLMIGAGYTAYQVSASATTAIELKTVVAEAASPLDQLAPPVTQGIQEAISSSSTKELDAAFQQFTSNLQKKNVRVVVAAPTTAPVVAVQKVLTPKSVIPVASQPKSVCCPEDKGRLSKTETVKPGQVVNAETKTIVARKAVSERIQKGHWAVTTPAVAVDQDILSELEKAREVK